MFLQLNSESVNLQIPIFVDCSGRRLSGSELPPWSISYPANVNHDHVIVDLDLSGNLAVPKVDRRTGCAQRNMFSLL